jgi:hypothetical protein
VPIRGHGESQPTALTVTHGIDLFTPAELDTLAALNERVLRHLAEESFPEEPTPDEPALPH